MVSIKNVKQGSTCKKVCGYCQKSFVRKAILKHHMLYKHMGYKVPCPICGKKYISTSVKNRHMRVTHNITNYNKFKEVPENDASSVKAEVAEAIPLNSSFQKDKSFPFMIDALKVKTNATFGRHIEANCDIGVGNTIMISSAYTSIAYLPSKPNSCFQCGKSGNLVLQCDHCIDIYFCSTGCHLSRKHREFCNELFDKDDCKIVRLTTEIIDKASKSFPSVDVFLEFSANILLKRKNHKQCNPPAAERQIGRTRSLSTHSKAYHDYFETPSTIHFNRHRTHFLMRHL